MRLNICGPPSASMDTVHTKYETVMKVTRNNYGRLNILIASRKAEFNKITTAAALSIISELNISSHNPTET